MATPTPAAGQAPSDTPRDLAPATPPAAAGAAEHPDRLGRPRLFPGLYRQATPAETPPPHDPTAAQTQAMRDLRDNLATLVEAQAEQQAQTSDVLTALHGLLKLLSDAQRPGEHLAVSLSASRGYALDDRGYRHSYLLLATAGSVTFDIPGIGLITRALSADWNRLCYPSGTRIGLATGADINALLWLTNDTLTTV